MAIPLPEAADRVRRTAKLMIILWSELVFTEASGAAHLISTAINLINDAAVIIEHPTLKQMQCISINSGVHAIDTPPHHILCGAEIDLNESIMPRLCVPTCEACIKLLEGKQ